MINSLKKVHFIGIGGISMSALAIVLHKRKIKVSGSDEKEGKITNKLKKIGITIYNKHKAKNIKDVDLVVYTGAISSENIELKTAKQKQIQCMERGEFLGLIASEYDEVIAISGAHGKTTTTAMISKIFIEAGLNPTVHVGGEVDFLGGNYRLGGKKFFITEACEYRKSFLEIKPSVSVILNIEMEHMECYGSFDNLKRAFVTFGDSASKLRVYNNKCILSSRQTFVSFGTDGRATYTTKNCRLSKNGTYSFDCYKNGKFIHTFRLGCVGIHNVSNALASIAVASFYNIDMDIVYKALSDFKGVKRRFERLPNFDNAEVVLDYAHHPSEIKSTIKAYREFYDGELVVIFQPHTYSRTALLFDDFLSALELKEVDRIILLPTYSAREDEKDGKNAYDLYKGLKTIRKGVKYFKFGSALNKELKKLASSKTAFLVLGAGDIDEYFRKLVTKGIVDINKKIK